MVIGQVRRRKILRQIFIYCFSILAQAISAHAQQRPDNKVAPHKLFGEAAIVTNYVEHGITQSDKNPAIQAGFGYQMGPQARLGVWGSSVKYSDESTSLNLRPYIDVKLDFTSNTGMIFRYDLNKYYSNDNRNGSLATIDLTSFGYHGIVELNDNWQGTHAHSTWFGFRKEFMLPRGFSWTPAFGYTQVSAGGYSSYFDLRVDLSYKLADMLYQASSTYASNASQFNGRASMFLFILSVNVRF